MLKQAARKLFVERGYDATRPQDIAREAGLGHGTFYLHYPDKRACFLSFVQEARQELDERLHARLVPGAGLEQRIAAMLAELRMTRIFAAHRPDTIRIADRIITLSRSGKISAEPASPRVVPTSSTRFYRGESYVQPK